MQQDQQEHLRRAERIEMLIQEVNELPDSRARATVEELVQALLDMYGEGLSHILELTARSEASGDDIDRYFYERRSAFILVFAARFTPGRHRNPCCQSAG